MRRLPRQVKASLEKACDSAILAVEVYNKPAVKFKSGGFITLMVIAWTSLFHAIFFARKRKPYYMKSGRRFKKVEGGKGKGKGKLFASIQKTKEISILPNN